MKNAEKIETTEAGNAIQLLTFSLDGEVFGADISQVQEVLEFENITRVPRTPQYMMGVINLRGTVVPVVDLRQQFEMKVSPPTVDTCIVIVDVLIDNEQTSLGLLADAVREVIVLNDRDISPAPKIGSSVDTRYILGMGKHNDEFLIILDLQKIFSTDELEELVGQLVDAEMPNANEMNNNASSQ